MSRLEEDDRTSFDELIRTELAGHGVMAREEPGPQVTLEGPKGVRLRSSTVQTLASGLHEFATNAVKHGALSRPEGHLNVRWGLTDQDGEACLRVEWRGRRILVVEDDTMLADDLRRDLGKQGAEVVGPVPTVADALELVAREGPLDAAVLDVNLRGERVFPVVDALRARGVPLAFTTGYEQWALPDAYADVPRCEKPIDLRQPAKPFLASAS